MYKYRSNVKSKIFVQLVYGPGNGNDQACQKWFVEFCVEDFLLNNAVQSSRLVEVDSKQVIT